MHNLNLIGLTLKLLLAVCILASKNLEIDAAGILPQYGIRPAQDFLFDMCAPPEPGQQHNTPWPVRVDDLCSSFGLNNPQLTEQACQVVDLLKMMLASPAAAPLKCQADAIPAPPAQDKDGLLLPLPLPDLRSSSSSSSSSRSLPELLTPSQTAAMLRAEGPSHLWLYKHVQHLAAWAPCEALGLPNTWQHPQGWQLLQVFNVSNNLKPYKLNATSLPFAAVLRQNSSPSSRAACRRALKMQQQDHAQYLQSAGDAARDDPPTTTVSSSGQDVDPVLRRHQLCSGDRLVVLLRGTASAHEWQYNLNYSMTVDASYGPGQVHAGFHNVAEQVLSAGLQQLLAQELARGGISNVMLAGHSLGGAVAALLAARLQKEQVAAQQGTLPATTPEAAGQPPPLITAVMFGAPNVGDAPFTADLNTRINARNIEYVADIVPQLPCAGHMPLCSLAPAASAEDEEGEDADSEQFGSEDGFGGDAAADGLSGGDGQGESSWSEGLASLNVSFYSIRNKLRARAYTSRHRSSRKARASILGGHSDSSSSYLSSSDSGSDVAVDAVSYARLGGQLRLEPLDMPVQQDAWRLLSTYRQDDFCDNLQTINALAQATHSCSYMCHLSHTAGLDQSWCMLWPLAEGSHGGGAGANATYCQHGRSSLYPMTPPFPPMT